MQNKRESDLWKQIDKLIFIIAILGLIILIGGYFIVANLKTIDPTLRELILNVITNIIPTSLLFIGAYLVFRHIEKLRSERNTDEIADKVIMRLTEIARIQATSAGESDPLLGKPIQFSELEMRLHREVETTVKPFEAKPIPQKILIECVYRGRNIIRIKKISYSGSKLSLSDLSKDYKLDDNGHRAIVPHEKQEVLSGEKFSVELILAKKWNKETIESWFTKLGYLHFEIEHDKETVELQKAL